MSGRIRTVKPEWLEDELLASLPDSDRTLSVGLILMADDHGRGRAADAFVAGEVWRYDRSPEVLIKAREGLMRLSGIRFIRLYIRDGQRYFEIRNWKIHQKVQHVGKPRVPPPLDSHESLKSPHEDSRDSQETLTPDLRPHISDLIPPTTPTPESGSGGGDPDANDLEPEDVGSAGPDDSRDVEATQRPVKATQSASVGASSAGPGPVPVSPVSGARRNPAIDALWQAMRDSRSFRDLATFEFAQELASHCREHGFTGRQSLTDMLASIREVDDKVFASVAAGEFTGRLSGWVVGAVKRGPKPSGGTTPVVELASTYDPRLERDEIGFFWDCAKHGPPGNAVRPVGCRIRNRPGAA